MKIDCNVNNSISHPPHPRRAVPANLPPGAFFFSMGSVMMLFASFLTTLLFLSPFALHATDDELFQKITELRLKSNAHGRFVNELLLIEPKFLPIEAPIQTSIENSPIEMEPEITPSLPKVAVPSESETQGSSSSEKAVPLPSEGLIEDKPMEEVPSFTESPAATSPNEPSAEDKEAPTYEELYAPKLPQRRLGYFFGPFIGAVFPDDSAVRKNNGGKDNYQSDTGFTAGLRIGSDFGFTRIEGEYGFLTHNIHSAGKSGKVQLHNFQSRLILEKSLGSRADLRGGIGLGLSLIDKSLGGQNYDGAGFSYDFLLGWSFRVMDNWSVNMDYRHYLTAAHENYDRLQGHVVELSASFDL